MALAFSLGIGKVDRYEMIRSGGSDPVDCGRPDVCRDVQGRVSDFQMALQCFWQSRCIEIADGRVFNISVIAVQASCAPLSCTAVPKLKITQRELGA